MTQKLVIAVDGPGSSGKGTVARAVARQLGYQYVDTGTMYRAVALLASRRGISWDEAEALGVLAAQLHFSFGWDGDVLQVTVNGEDVTSALRRDEVGQGASRVSRHPAVRQALLGLQRSLGASGGVVMDGRDIGTVVLPGADLKIFLDAELTERARRRHEELVQRGETVSLQQVHAALEARDKQDREREVAPLCPAADAILLDTTTMSISEVVSTIVSMAREKD